MNSLCKGLIMKRIWHVQEPEIDHWVCSTVSKDRSGMKPAWRGAHGCRKVTLMDTHIVRHTWSSSLRSSLWPLLRGSLFSHSTVLAMYWSLAWGSYIKVNNPPSNRCQTNQSESRVEQRRLGKDQAWEKNTSSVFDPLMWDDSNARHLSEKFRLTFRFEAQKRSLG